MLRVFGSWNAALDGAELDTHRYAWTHAETLDALQSCARANGCNPTISESRTGHGELPPSATCARLFGSWNAALRAAGLSRIPPAHWSPTAILEALRAWASWPARAGVGVPSKASYRAWASTQADPVPSTTTISRHFAGSWNGARTAAGRPASRAGAGRRWRRDRDAVLRSVSWSRGGRHRCKFALPSTPVENCAGFVPAPHRPPAHRPRVSFRGGRRFHSASIEASEAQGSSLERGLLPALRRVIW